MADVPSPRATEVDRLVARANAGDRDALERLVRAVQPDVHALALRFLWHPEDAEDATQEILVRVITGLATFRGESAFRTWVYRVACNTLCSLGPRRMERRAVSLDAFGEDLARGLSDEPFSAGPGSDAALLLEEVKVGCTLAMLLCLDRPHRLAYILGEILELDHREAATALEIAPTAFRKRLSRARGQVETVMIGNCGLVNPASACRCRRRVNRAVALGRVDPSRLLFASSRRQARAFPAVLRQIRRLEAARRAAALYRSHAPGRPSGDLVSWVRGLVAGRGARSGASSSDPRVDGDRTAASDGRTSRPTPVGRRRPAQHRPA